MHKVYRAVPMAPDEMLQGLEDTVTALFQGILARQKESCTLATLRDTLLPKLLSGEVRVGWGEASVHQVT